MTAGTDAGKRCGKCARRQPLDAFEAKSRLESSTGLWIVTLPSRFCLDCRTTLRCCDACGRERSIRECASISAPYALCRDCSPAGRRRARLREAARDRHERHAIFARDQWRCWLCGERLDEQSATIDHFVPIAKGGGHTADNVRTACRWCKRRARGGRGLDSLGAPDDQGRKGLAGSTVAVAGLAVPHLAQLSALTDRRPLHARKWQSRSRNPPRSRNAGASRRAVARRPARHSQVPGRTCSATAPGAVLARVGVVRLSLSRGVRSARQACAVVRGWVMWAMFLSSYSPLFLLVGLRSVDDSHAIAIVAGLLVIAGAAGTVLLLSAAPSKTDEIYKLVEVEKRDGDVAAYAATYLLPFLTVFNGKTLDVISLAAFVAFLGFIYVRSRLIYVNPVLMLLGYHLWRVIPVTDGAATSPEPVRWPRYLLADTTRVRKGQRIRAHSLTDDLLLYDEDLTPDASAPQTQGGDAGRKGQALPAQDEDAW
jgi:5-methylcytosine-specific restriction endonuclease McrA